MCGTRAHRLSKEGERIRGDRLQFCRALGNASRTTREHALCSCSAPCRVRRGELNQQRKTIKQRWIWD